ncbi:hypothetical protein GCM10011502_03980 [Oceanisphaera marina]|uniref:DUF1449 domain-containing protein n=1 Tax=Oceanisphaera marina TaxID=2017550 RepID=A0ABQ1IC60_9GAMM|nr:hypothetical protein [Oceanisphaera marina]GGB34140.1 hypothetical protein GCM10011502_03980 [Oceanisphaera marina]
MDVWQTFFAFPVVMTAIPFLLFLLLLLFSVFTGLFDELLPSLNVDADLPDMLLPIGITQIPIVVSLPLVFFLATAELFMFSHLVTPLVPAWLFYTLATLAIPLACYLSLYLAAWILKPLAPLFDQSRVYASINYIGMRARVRTSRVGAHFGEVVVTRGSVENQLDVYCDDKEELHYGDEVRILSFNDVTRRYFITKQ